MRLKLLRPRVIVEYVREAFVHPAENTRITFDKSLATCPNSLDLFSDRLLTVRPIDDDVEILEVKYDAFLPEIIQDLIQVNGIRQQAFSKYGACRRFG